MQSHIQITIPVTDQSVQEILVAQLSMEGYDAFEQDETLLKAFIEEHQFDEAALKTTLSAYSLAFEKSVLPATNWNQEWEKNFQPVIVDDFCGIRASFHNPLANVEHEIVITPKMSFGTGHHATTYMMMQLMRTVNFGDKFVFDFGTGTGVLAILADKLGAKEILAMDNDEWSIINATENVAANKCDHVLVQNGSNIPASKSFDIVLANINKQVIVETIEQMIAQVSNKGIVLLSGLLQADFADVHELAVTHGLSLHEQRSRSGWIALKYQLV
jgi:ribosomal protein L11 methyltransferase